MNRENNKSARVRTWNTKNFKIEVSAVTLVCPDIPMHFNSVINYIIT